MGLRRGLEPARTCNTLRVGASDAVHESSGFEASTRENIGNRDVYALGDDDLSRTVRSIHFNIYIGTSLFHTGHRSVSHHLRIRRGERMGSQFWSIPGFQYPHLCGSASARVDRHIGCCDEVARLDDSHIHLAKDGHRPARRHLHNESFTVLVCQGHFVTHNAYQAS